MNALIVIGYNRENSFCHLGIKKTIIKIFNENNITFYLIDLYKDRNLKSYIELILGLPLETLQSFKDGIYKILDIGFTDFVDIHPLTALPNTPFFDSEYIKKYGIRLVETAPAFFHHENAEDLINEKEMMVVGSDTMPLDEYVEASLFKWYISFCEHLGGTSFIALLLDKIYDIKRSDFYDKLYEYSKQNTNTFLGKEYVDTKEALYLVLDKKQCFRIFLLFFMIFYDLFTRLAAYL